jgi:hypothetical protein
VPLGLRLHPHQGGLAAKAEKALLGLAEDFDLGRLAGFQAKGAQPFLNGLFHRLGLNFHPLLHGSHLLLRFFPRCCDAWGLLVVAVGLALGCAAAALAGRSGVFGAASTGSGAGSLFAFSSACRSPSRMIRACCPIRKIELAAK